MKKDAYLQRILTAKVYDVAVESPLDPLPSISRRTSNHLLLKREDKATTRRAWRSPRSAWAFPPRS